MFTCRTKVSYCFQSAVSVIYVLCMFSMSHKGLLMFSIRIFCSICSVYAFIVVNRFDIVFNVQFCAKCVEFRIMCSDTYRFQL